jgi:hypothetical protein
MTVFSNDISSSKSDIVIVSPYMTKKRLSQMLNILSSGINNGAKLTIVTRPEADYKDSTKPLGGGSVIIQAMFSLNCSAKSQFFFHFSPLK